MNKKTATTDKRTTDYSLPTTEKNAVDGSQKSVDNSKVKELEEQNKRLLADYQNLEKRVEGERRNLISQSNKQLLLNLLPILDTLMLAQKHGGDQGLDLSVKQFLDILKQEGAEKIEVLGKSFDPHLMEAIDAIDGEEGKVMEEVRTGYRLYDQVLRPAQVRVGKGKN